MIQYFRKSLKILIWVEMKPRGQKLDNYDEIVQKPVDTEIKRGLRTRFYTYEID